MAFYDGKFDNCLQYIVPVLKHFQEPPYLTAMVLQISRH